MIHISMERKNSKIMALAKVVEASYHQGVTIAIRESSGTRDIELIKA